MPALASERWYADSAREITVLARRYAESCEMGRFFSSQFSNDLIDPSAHNPPGIAVGQDADARVGEASVRECAFRC